MIITVTRIHIQNCNMLISLALIFPLYLCLSRTQTHTRTHARAHTLTRTYTHTHTCTRIHIYVNTHIHTHTYSDFQFSPPHQELAAPSHTSKQDWMRNEMKNLKRKFGLEKASYEGPPPVPGEDNYEDRAEQRWVRDDGGQDWGFAV